MKRLLNIFAALALSLPACAFATIYSFHNTAIEFRGDSLPVEGYFIYDGTSITDWDFTAGQHWFPEMPDPLDCYYFAFCSPIQFARVISPTAFVFVRDSSPAGTRFFHLFLDAPLNGLPVTIDTTRSEVAVYDYEEHYPVIAGSLMAIVPEPQTWVMLALALALVLVVVARKDQVSVVAVDNLRRRSEHNVD